MPEPKYFFDEIDNNRSRRVRELSEIKRRFAGGRDSFGIGSRAVIILAYAQWEGFYNDCVRIYTQFLKNNGGRLRDTDWMMLVGATIRELQSLRDRNHSHEARRDFVASLRDIIDCGYDRFDPQVIMARSNLNFETLSANYHILNFDIDRFRPYRLRIDREIVSWRHQAAHGDQPDLSQLDINKHIDFVANLLLLVADQFQEAMSARLASPL
ncbi:MAG TPA: MAE_28990/MAE_18760 family HEPN-like nuclease [Methylovirgula sp.]|jgi:hypothetical protein|nr:MAE_28990/MAE_18760 family HEPN-like nuclease [Methylovirgula sp.]